MTGTSHQAAIRLAAIDALRGVAALAVLVSHLPFSMSTQPALGGHAMAASALPSWFDRACEQGMHGVNLFLIISGFCIHLAWARQPAASRRIGFGQFWRRRLHRLYPPYLAALGLTLAGLLVLHGVIGGARGSLVAALGYASRGQLALDLVLLLLLAQNLNGASHRIGNGPFWTLALEEQLYALYFPLVWLRRRWEWPRTLALVTAITVGWRILAPIAAPQWHDALLVGPSRWLEWALGAVAAEAHLGRITLPRWCSSVVPGSVILAVAVALANTAQLGVSLDASAISDGLFGLAFFVLLNAACRMRWAEPGGGAAGRFFAWVGTFSYSLYLTHALVIVAAKQLALRTGVGVMGIIVLRLTLPVLLGLLFYCAIERRFINSSRRSSGNQRAQS